MGRGRGTKRRRSVFRQRRLDSGCPATRLKDLDACCSRELELGTPMLFASAIRMVMVLGAAIGILLRPGRLFAQQERSRSADSVAAWSLYQTAFQKVNSGGYTKES